MNVCPKLKVSSLPLLTPWYVEDDKLSDFFPIL
ncbi:tryptophanase leader peptide [Photobacterium alginatilyticum]|uniref:Tryptophanase leader peptide n=1 Tax=Photobacterium alginatilyticum TaxID=1775171 RepID=A0ABW9YJ86_9GAMM|nr:tryptophanase leader peptide [Photobacterium alginatilyticum]